MSLYGNFTLKEWLAFHDATKDIDDLFRKALKDNDEPMAVLALAELINRGDINLVTYVIQEATDAGYENLTLKEWLALHRAAKDIDDLFRKALKDNDEPMAVLALAELINRGDINLVTYAIQEATDAGSIVLGSHFSTVFANALTQCGNRDPILAYQQKVPRKQEERISSNAFLLRRVQPFFKV